MNRKAVALGIGSLAVAFVAGVDKVKAAECYDLPSGAVMCEDTRGLYYREPLGSQFVTIDPATAIFLLVAERDAAGSGGTEGPADESGSAGRAVFGNGGSSLTSTNDGCLMFSAPGYSFGSNLSFSSGC